MKKPTELHTQAAIDSELEVHDYVVGRMTTDEASAFEARIADDPELTDAVAEERQLARDLAPAADATVAADAFEKLSRELERPRLLRHGTAIAAALGMLTLVLLLFPQQQPPPFETLSDPREPVADELTIRVVFAAGIGAGERQHLGGKYGFEVIAGPEASGAFLVRVPAPLAASDLSRWREDPAIAFAEPAR